MSNKRTLKLVLLKAATGSGSGKSCRYGCSEGNALERLLHAANTHNPDILVAPEYFFYNEKPLTEEEKKELEKRIAEGVEKKDMLVIPGSIVSYNAGNQARNTSPVITDGRVITEHMKATDGGCGKLAKKHNMEYVKGPKVGTIAPWQGLDIGLEICLDHGQGMLKKEGKKVGIHIVPACEMSHCDWNDCARVGGYFILCDGHENYRNTVKQRTGEKDFRDIEGETVGDAEIYMLEVQDE